MKAVVMIQRLPSYIIALILLLAPIRLTDQNQASLPPDQLKKVVAAPSQSTAIIRNAPRQIINSVLRDACIVGCSKNQLATYRRNLRFEMHDVNADSVVEFFVYIEHGDFCGVSFNCEYWVFQRRHKGYRLIAGGYPVIRVTRTVTNGFNDLESQGYMGGCTRPDGSWGREIYLTTFKFTGTKYRPTEIGEQCRAR